MGQIWSSVAIYKSFSSCRKLSCQRIWEVGHHRYDCCVGGSFKKSEFLERSEKQIYRKYTTIHTNMCIKRYFAARKIFLKNICILTNVKCYNNIYNIFNFWLHRKCYDTTRILVFITIISPFTLARFINYMRRLDSIDTVTFL